MPVITVPRTGASIPTEVAVPTVGKAANTEITKAETAFKVDDSQIASSNIETEEVKKHAFVLEIPVPFPFAVSSPIEYWNTIYSGSLLPEASLKLDGVTNIFSARGRQEAFFVKNGIYSIIVELIRKQGITDFVINGPIGKQFAVRGIRDGRNNKYGKPSIIIEGLHLTDQISVDENKKIQPLQLEVINQAFIQIRKEPNGYSNDKNTDFGYRK